MKNSERINNRILYKDMIKNRVLDEWLDEEEPNKSFDEEELGDYDLSGYEEE